MIKDIAVVAILVAIVVLALAYIGKQKKKGNKCIGCPHGGNCSGSCSSQSKE